MLWQRTDEFAEAWPDRLETLFGGQFNHQLLPVAHDSSYALSLLGIGLVLRAAIKRKRMIVVLTATFIAGIALAYRLTML